MKSTLCSTIERLTTRRQILQRSACGFGWLAFASQAYQPCFSEESLHTLAPKKPPLEARAKRVIFLCMRGAPSHLDLLDYKPKLFRDTGKPGPKPGSRLLGSKWRFSRQGQSGLWISELLPELSSHVDKMSMIYSMQTDLPAHPQAFIKLHTGSSQFIRPSLGAWTLYGLGSENANLPGFVSISPPSGFGGTTNYGSSFLPAIYQGTRLGNEGSSIKHATLSNLKGRLPARDQRAELDLIQSFNREKLASTGPNPEIDGVIESYELAFRMQSEMPRVLDLNQESAATQKAYGLGGDRTDAMGRKCLLARRMIESGVRFVEVTHGNWDHHFNLNANLEQSCSEVDQPIAALLADLAQRGLLDETLVVWSGEFGRTPYAEGQEGRDHNTKAFTLWMAGSGIRGGFAYGASDDYGYEAIDKPVQIADLHATILHALGLDHEQLTYRHAGRDFRLTDIHGHVVKEIFA